LADGYYLLLAEGEGHRGVQRIALQH
jgi:hypothetical protein